MGAVIIDGAAVAQAVRDRVREDVAKAGGRGVVPCLAVVLVGDDPASVSYVTGKEKALAEAGMRGKSYKLSASVSQGELEALIEELNRDPETHGILVQSPLPAPLDEDKILSLISPQKDVDGLTPANIGNLASGNPAFVPCTPRGVLALLQTVGIETRGAYAVIVGRSNLVGRPLSILLSSKPHNATVTLCHTGTRDLAAFTRQADILIAACGKPRMIGGDMIKPGAAVIDVGVNRVADPSKKSGFRLVGDVDFDAAKEVASYITPVPRGVGPMTIAMLLKNTQLAYERLACERLAAGAENK
jgi:methylenetetrahydrofolate dehydrogenase (NADP+)/methenyltetrahydrofolate cyclohydrolase